MGKMHIHDKPQQLMEGKRSNYFTTVSGMFFLKPPAVFYRSKAREKRVLQPYFWVYEMWEEATYLCVHTCRGKLFSKPIPSYNLESLVAA